MAQSACLRGGWSRWWIGKRKQLDLILISNPQIQLEGSSVFAIHLPNNLETKKLDIESLRLRIVRADDGNMMNAIEHASSSWARIQNERTQGTAALRLEESASTCRARMRIISIGLGRGNGNRRSERFRQ